MYIIVAKKHIVSRKIVIVITIILKKIMHSVLLLPRVINYISGLNDKYKLSAR